ncbi:OLC1v1033353C1 [Oldenlandia corymbosa var. corymbosa]|uniref:OLC1v1033353C1 n=1 Tax=Oldenlandia corymbosa var. corymbosa TaxID=529605 RepID=A0AAV1CNW4_OLDCO|nr:OLC1v1033353C1 [Oldenlandia corymbosa var. corymbosa]
MGANHKIFSHDEVSVHNNSSDCWIIINAKAYDVTNFLSEHPGGDDVLLAAAGKDASEEFENAGHGSAARLMLDEYYVGEIDPSSSPTPPNAKIPASTAYLNKDPKDDKESSSFLLKLLPFLLILGLAFGIHFYTKSN